MSSSLRQPDASRASRIISSGVLIFSCAASAGIIGWLLVFSRYGLDFTDEGFYIVWIAEPWNYQVSVSQFGFIYHPLHELLGGDIVRLRQANVFIVGGLAWILCLSFFRCTMPSLSAQTWHSLPMLAVAAVLAASSLAFFRYWILTPSYNSLAFQALLVTVIGFLWADTTASRTSLIGWVLIGAGGWLAFMAKPPSAVALGIVTAIYLMLAGKLVFRLVAVAVLVAAALLLTSAFIIDGSMNGFLTRLRTGVEGAGTLEAGYAIGRLLRLDDFVLAATTKNAMALGTFAVFASTCLCASKKGSFTAIGLAFPLTVALVELAVTSGIVVPEIGWSAFRGLLFWTAPLGVIAGGLSLMRMKLLSSVSRSHWALAICFSLLPHVFAFGTNGNYWEAGSAAGLFWVLAGLSLFPSAPGFWQPLLPAAALAQGVGLLLVYTAAEHPYRQPQPLRLNDDTIAVGSSGTQFILNAGFAKYFRDLTALANPAGFQPDTPMIDMTGQTPTALYALRAKSIGQAWTIGGYKGSDRLAIDMLKFVPCEEIGRTWLLVEREGPRRLSAGILEHFGIDMDRHFEEVGTIQVPAGAGGYPEGRVQTLLKPRRAAAEAQAACEGARRAPPKDAASSWHRTAMLASRTNWGHG